MLIVCTKCQSKIRVPDQAAGKKGKCPKCGTLLTISAAAEPPPASGASAGARTGAGDMPPLQPLGPPPLPPSLNVPEVDVEEAPAAPPAATAYASAVPPPLPSAPPPLPRTSRGSRDDDDRPSRRDRDDDDEPRRRSRDDDDEDDLNIRRPRRRRESTAMSMTGMILGISGLLVTVASIAGGMLASSVCCCGILGGYAGFTVSGLLGVLGMVFGFIGLNQGGKNFAWTGIITGGVNLLAIVAFVVLSLIFGFALFGFFAAAVANQPQPNFGPPPPNFGPPPPNFGPPPGPKFAPPPRR